MQTFSVNVTALLNYSNGFLEALHSVILEHYVLQQDRLYNAGFSPNLLSMFLWSIPGLVEDRTKI